MLHGKTGRSGSDPEPHKKPPTGKRPLTPVLIRESEALEAMLGLPEAETLEGSRDGSLDAQSKSAPENPSSAKASTRETGE